MLIDPVQDDENKSSNGTCKLGGYCGLHSKEFNLEESTGLLKTSIGVIGRTSRLTISFTKGEMVVY